MKKLLCFGLFFALYYTPIIAQSGYLNTSTNKTKWTTNPFDHQVFIANAGQFDGSIPGNVKILYGAQLGNVWAYFTQHGIVYCYKEFPPQTPKGALNGKDPDEDGPVNPVIHYMSSDWVGSNPSVVIETKDKEAYYYTYPKGTNGTIKTDIFKKIIYRNIYPGIDMEYIFPKGKDGLKYSIIVHPGADISKIKLQYKSAGALKLNSNGDVTFNSKVGEITDHTPISYYTGDSEDVMSFHHQIIKSSNHQIENNVSYKVNGNTESFNINDRYDKSKTLIIDPWITNPLFALNHDKAYDLDYDYKGNVYAYGSWLPLQLEKFNSFGVPQWIYNVTQFITYYGDLVVNRTSGTIYLTEGFNISGARVIKVWNNGSYQAISPGVITLDEMWRAVYDACKDTIIIGAGGTQGSYQACILDTNMGAPAPVNVLSANEPYHDIVLLAPDPSGLTCYMATALSSIDNLFNNQVMQLPLPSLSPTAYLTHDNFAYRESNVPTYTGNGNNNGYDGMAVSSDWLYIYNSITLKRLNKATGRLVDSIPISNAVLINAKPNWGGLAVDPCDDIFVGCHDSIKVYNSSLQLNSSIRLANTIYDVVFGNNLLYACGDSFVCALALPPLASLISTASGSPSSCSACNGSATATVNCGVAPFHFHWSNGSTNQTDTGLCAGLYTVTVTDGSCPPRQDSAIASISGKPGYSASVVDTNPGCQLNGGNITVYPYGGTLPYTYSWSNGATTQQVTRLGGGNYICVITDNAGCKYDVYVTLANTAPVSATMAHTDVLCDRDSSGTATVTITGGRVPPYTYSWSNGSKSQQDTGLSTGEYYVTVTDNMGCKFIDSVAITVYHASPISVVPPSDSICIDSSVVLTVSGANTYRWSPARGLSCYNCPSPTASPTATTTYTITGTDLHGCVSTTTVPIKVLAKPVPLVIGKDSVCQGNFITLTANGGSNYVWNPGFNTNSSISVSPLSNTIYTLTASNGICSRDTTFKVTVVLNSIATIAASKDSLCLGDSLTLTGSGGGTYRWSPGNSTNSTIHVNPLTTTTYSLFTYNTVCIDSATRTIKIIPAPAISVSASNDSICPSATATLTLTATGQVTYKWSTGATTSSITVNPSIPTTYTATVYGICDSAQKAVTVGIYPLPVPAISGTNWKCRGVTDTLTVSGGGTYLWSNGNTGATYITKGIDSDTTLCVTVKSNHGCPAADSFKITLIPLPVVTFTSTQTICAGQCTTLKVNVSDSGNNSFLWSNAATTDTTTVCPETDSIFSIKVTNACGNTKKSATIKVYAPSLLVCCDTTIDKGNTAILTANNSTGYKWVPNTGLNCDTCQNVKATPDATTTYTVTSTDANGCTDVSLVTVKVEIMCFDFNVPNVFTPNGDGINDYFKILSLPSPEVLYMDTYTITIYDRWGKEMYKSTNPTQSWNGNTEGGAQASDGIYYWIITATCQGKNYNKNGFVQVVR